MSAEVEQTSGRSPASWRHAAGSLALLRARVMAIVNVTPDSFYDGGRLLRDDARAPDLPVVRSRCRALAREGAAILDVGGESTRPGARAVSPAEERARVVPVIRAPARDEALAGALISVDTRRAEVARAAVAAGAAIINDVSGLADPEMARVAAETGAGLVLGHMRGVPETMQTSIGFTDLLREVAEELRASVARARAAGVAPEQLVIDPGVGFGKTAEQSAALVVASRTLRELVGYPVLIGASRKSFLGAITRRAVDDRMSASVAAAVLAVRHGASVVRVHDVVETVDALRVAAALERAYDERVASASRAGGAPR
ncbi:MAG: dihydropteroate synthase [Myxococcales bacterium]|nr:dihydropteroate synthase [Myxococcales bacterium]